MILALDDSNTSFAFTTLAFSVAPELRTRIVPSHLFDKICASATERTGGASKMTMSYSVFISLMKASIVFEPSSSAGFGGIDPHVIRISPSIPVSFNDILKSPLPCKQVG